VDTEDLLPRLALFAGLIAAVIVYRQRRNGKLKHVQENLADVPQQAAASAAEAATGIAERGQSLIESVLDNIAEQALKELKTALKEGLKRLEKTVDAL
jgi:predicted histidine transporter YuiF (NhaC family)